jgi:hypothetical protein
MVTVEASLKRYLVASLLIMEGAIALASIVKSVITGRVRQDTESRQDRLLRGAKK